jgi:hemolysin activation/secretion protein
MEGPSGGTASTLIALVMAQLQNRGLVDLEHIEQALQILIDRCLTAEQITDAHNALTVVQGLRNS